MPWPSGLRPRLLPALVRAPWQRHLASNEGRQGAAQGPASASQTVARGATVAKEILQACVRRNPLRYRALPQIAPYCQETAICGNAVTPVTRFRVNPVIRARVVRVNQKTRYPRYRVTAASLAPSQAPAWLPRSSVSQGGALLSFRPQIAPW